MFIRNNMFINFWEIFPPTCLFYPTRLLGTPEYFTLRLDQNASFYLKTPCVPPHLMCYIQQHPIYKQLRVHGYGELASTCMTPASRGYFPRQ